MKEKIKEATQEEVAEQKSTKQTSEEKEKMDDKEELNVKKKQLNNDTVNLYGGDVQVGAGRQTLLPLATRIARRKRTVEKLKVMREKYAPVEVKFAFENDPRYKAIAKEELMEEQASVQKEVDEMIKLKEEMEARIPESQKRINELEKKLNLDITDFKAKTPEYIG